MKLSGKRLSLIHILMKRDVLNKISRVINYEESERARLNVYVDQLGDQQEEYLLIGEELILRLDNKIRKITFDEIKEINVSMCSRLYNPVSYTHLGKGRN